MPWGDVQLPLPVIRELSLLLQEDKDIDVHNLLDIGAPCPIVVWTDTVFRIVYGRHRRVHELPDHGGRVSIFEEDKMGRNKELIICIKYKRSIFLYV